MKEKENDLSTVTKTIKILEDKLAHAEKELFKESNNFKTKKDEALSEIHILKESLRKSQLEVFEKSKTINEVNNLSKINK